MHGRRLSEFVQNVRASGRTMLNEFEAKQTSVVVRNSRRRTRGRLKAKMKRWPRPSEIGYPVVVKLLSNTIAHKTDVDGVRLGLQNRSKFAVRSDPFKLR